MKAEILCFFYDLTFINFLEIQLTLQIPLFGKINLCYKTLTEKEDEDKKKRDP